MEKGNKCLKIGCEEKAFQQSSWRICSFCNKTVVNLPMTYFCFPHFHEWIELQEDNHAKVCKPNGKTTKENQEDMATLLSITSLK